MLDIGNKKESEVFVFLVVSKSAIDLLKMATWKSKISRFPPNDPRWLANLLKNLNNSHMIHG